MHKFSELHPVDKALADRADWFVQKTGIEKYLRPEGKYLDIGTGKGHIVQTILNNMENSGFALKGYYSLDVADKPLNKVQKRERTRQDMGSAVNSQDKNPMNFMWAASESLPFKDQSLDGVSFIFSIHHMPAEKLDQIINEAKRVLKKEGHIFIAEDIVDPNRGIDFMDKKDRQLNWEDYYKSDEEWKKYFGQQGLRVANSEYFQSDYKKGTVKHAFYVLERLVDRQEVFHQLNKAKKILKNKYGVDDLSTIEGVHLRILVEQCMREAKRDSSRVDEIMREAVDQEKRKGEKRDDLKKLAQHIDVLAVDNPSSEAVARWLLEYGINIEDVPVCDIITDKDTGKTYKIFWPTEIKIRQIAAITLSEEEYNKALRVSDNFLEDREKEINKKMEEIKKLGHQAEVKEFVIEPEFKEYLRRLRAKAHKL